MGQRSKIELLPPEVKAAVDRLVRAKRTIEDIVAHLDQLGEPISKSSVGRYKKSFEEELKRLRRAQDMAAVVVGEIGEGNPSALGEAASQLLSTAIFTASMSLTGEDDDAVDIKAVKALSEATRNLSQASKLRTDTERLIRQIVREEQAAALAKLERDHAAAAAAGNGRVLDPDTLAEVRRIIVGS